MKISFFLLRRLQKVTLAPLSSFRCLSDQSISEIGSQEASATPPSWDTSLRIYGFVTGFKHRRGYGFVLAEGYTRRSLEVQKKRELEKTSKNEHRQATAGFFASSKDFFFSRSALGDGFYVTEGDCVSFRVKVLEEAETKQKTSAPEYASRGTSMSSDLEDDTAVNASRHGKRKNFVALGLRRYDVASGGESRILPVSINGTVISWDEESGSGVIAELDLKGVLYDDAPKFRVLSSEVDLSPSPKSDDSFLEKGRYVKFCFENKESNAADDSKTNEEASLPLARRVIIDRTAEGQHGLVFKSKIQRPSFSSPPSSVLPEQRGVIREIIEDKYGFIVDDATGESLFFHLSEMNDSETAEPHAGDTVVYDVETISRGRHSGKKQCSRIRLLSQSFEGSILSESSLGNTKGSSSAFSDSSEKRKSILDEFDLLD